MKKQVRDQFEAAIITRFKESGFLEVEIRVECLQRAGDDYQDSQVSIAWWAWQASKAVIEPSFYWPDGDEGGASTVEEMAQDAYQWDGSLWEEQRVACAYELPTRTYRSFLDDKGEVQVERIDSAAQQAAQ